MQTLNIASTLHAQLVAAGIPIIGLSIGSSTDKTTWVVQPPDLQSAAQPIIDAFDIASQELAFQWCTLRSIRDNKLYSCDFTQAADSPLTAGEMTQWATYRQALRDLPATTADPFNVTWPTAPWVLNPKPV